MTTSYQGLIKKSRTLDAIALLALLNTMYPVLMEALPNWGLQSSYISIINVLYMGLLAYLRYKTTGPVGVK